jgi:hypothetical protein
MAGLLGQSPFALPTILAAGLETELFTEESCA